MLLSTSVASAAKKNPAEKCHFRDTVDLTNSTRFENGSYLYHDILIPADKTAFYNYKLQFRGKPKSVKNHIRGCVCDASKGRYCVKFCCEKGEFLNSTSYACDKMPEHFKEPKDLKIYMKKQKTFTLVNIYNHFTNQIGRPCGKPDAINMNTDPWYIVEVSMGGLNILLADVVSIYFISLN